MRVRGMREKKELGDNLHLAVLKKLTGIIVVPLNSWSQVNEEIIFIDLSYE